MPAPSAPSKYPPWIALLILAIAFAAAFIFDENISRVVTEHRPERLDPTVVFLTSWKCEFSLLGALSIGLLALKRTRAVAFTWGTFLVGEAIGTALKYSFRRPRPYLAHDIANLVEESTPSFPSNHSLALFTAAFALGACFPRLRPWAIAWAILIAFTRIYVGVHYTTDVLGGALIGFGVVRIATHRFGAWAREETRTERSS